MSETPNFPLARHRLDTERQPYNLETVRALPEDGCGVYALWAGPDECLYIGKSDKGNSVKARLLAHLSPQEPNRELRQDLYRCRDDREFAVCLTAGAEWADELETRLIEHYDTKHNRNKLGRRSPTRRGGGRWSRPAE